MRKVYDDVFGDIKKIYNNVNMAIRTDNDCYQGLINLFENHCGKFSEYGMKYMRVFYDICGDKNESVVGVRRIILGSCN